MNVSDVQGNVLAGFNKPRQRFAMLGLPRVVADAKAWLAEVAAAVTGHELVAEHNAAGAWERGEHPVWVALGLTRSGLERLGVENLQRALADHWAFAQGAAARAVDMGDVDASDPAGWLFGSGDRAVDAVVTVAGDDEAAVDARLGEILERSHDRGADVVHLQVAARLADGREHFGFKDGGHQPKVRELNDGDGDADLTDFVLPDETEPSWLANASFQVVRLLAQDVAGWNEAAGDAEQRIGRARDGADLPDVPASSHVGKTRPAAEFGPEKRRLMRRGVPYGPPYDTAPDQERGLVFNAFMASIDRQYEHIQRLWANKVDFPALDTGWDPVIGGPDPDAVRAYQDGGPQPQYPPRHVWTRGAVYAVALSLSGLYQLGATAGYAEASADGAE
jgi:Dyp-type peroxidase family